jgi:hypothetical protein
VSARLGREPAKQKLTVTQTSKREGFGLAPKNGTNG